MKLSEFIINTKKEFEEAIFIQNLTLLEKCLYSEFFWSVFSRFWTEHGSEYGYFLHSVSDKETLTPVKKLTN